MALTFNRKIELVFSKQDELALDGQSKICNWQYNKLLQVAKEDYKNGSPLKLMEGYNLRNYGTKLKKEYPFLNVVFSSPLKNTSLRLRDAFQRFFDGNGGYPKFRSWKKKWFSLYFDEPNKGFKLLDSKQIQISFGKNEEGKQIYINGKLKEPFSIQENERLKTFRVCKQQGDRFYGIFTIDRYAEGELEAKEAKKERKKLEKEMFEGLWEEFSQSHSYVKPTRRVRPKKKKKKQTTKYPSDIKWISLDPNHKNLFVAVDYKGKTYEFSKLFQTKYWDAQIDKIKSKRDICQRKSKLCLTYHGNKYWKSSKRWNKLNIALDRAYHKRREQIKTALYSIAHYLYDHYDLVVIGDYTPTKGTACFKNMHRSMLNQEHIGQLRSTLEWVATKRNKHYEMVNERNTTKDCCVCGTKEKKDPSVRIFTCASCNHTIVRDVNSAINIAKKATLLSGSDWVTEWKFDKITYAVQSVLHGEPHNLSIVPTASQAEKLNPMEQKLSLNLLLSNM